VLPAADKFRISKSTLSLEGVLSTAQSWNPEPRKCSQGTKRKKRL